MKIRVLFLCSTNAVQSPIAEALLKRMDPEHFEVISAGIGREAIHPFTIEVMKEIGVDLEGHVSRTLRDVTHLPFDFVITLSEHAKFNGSGVANAELVHWQIDDPTNVTDKVRQLRMFKALRDQIVQRVRLFALVQVRSTTKTMAHHAGVSA